MREYDLTCFSGYCYRISLFRGLPCRVRPLLLNMRLPRLAGIGASCRREHALIFLQIKLAVSAWNSECCEVAGAPLPISQ